MVKHFVLPYGLNSSPANASAARSFLAGALLLAFLAQGIWLVHSELSTTELPVTAPSASEQVRIAAGWRQFHGEA